MKFWHRNRRCRADRALCKDHSWRMLPARTWSVLLSTLYVFTRYCPCMLYTDVRTLNCAFHCFFATCDVLRERKCTKTQHHKFDIPAWTYGAIWPTRRGHHVYWSRSIRSLWLRPTRQWLVTQRWVAPPTWSISLVDWSISWLLDCLQWCARTLLHGWFVDLLDWHYLLISWRIYK